MRDEGSLHSNLCFVILLSSEQCSQFERFQLQHVLMVNKTSNFKTKLTGNNAEVCTVNRNTLELSHALYRRLPVTDTCSANSGQTTP